MMRSRMTRMLLGAALVVAAGLALPAPANAAAAGPGAAAGQAAAAAHDDSFSKCTTTTACDGRVRFVDHGEGKPGGGSNDDYIVCEDNHSNYVIGCWLWYENVYRGGVISSGDGAVVWEPWAGWNVTAGQYVGIKVCWRYESSGDWKNCANETRRSFDG